MRGRLSCLLQSAGAEANRILLALSSMHIICPNKVSRRDWMIAVSLGCFVSLRTSSFRTNWYHLMPSSIRRHHWSQTPQHFTKFKSKTVAELNADAADALNGQRQVSRMTGRKGETWSPFGMSAAGPSIWQQTVPRSRCSHVAVGR